MIEDEYPTISAFPEASIPAPPRVFETAPDWYRRHFGPDEPKASLVRNESDEEYFDKQMRIAFG